MWEHYSRKTLDPSQRLTVEVLMAQRADGRWAAATTGREMPRQNGKGDEIEVVELWGLVQRSEAILHTIHDAVLLASQTQQRMLGVIEGHADLRRLKKRAWQGTGQQMIEMRNGGIIWYRTRTGGGGRGVDEVDRLVIDEAQHATEEHLAALSPTLLANKNPQLNAMGTAALPGKSDWWWGFRKRALGSDPGAFGYIGHTAETVYLNESGRVVQEPVDVDDRALWSRSNPAIVAGRGQGIAYLEEQRRLLSPTSFAQEHLCVWAPDVGQDTRWEIVSEAQWETCRKVLSEATGPVSYALDVDTDIAGTEWCSIAASDGEHVEIVNPPDAGPGLEWVVPLCTARRERFAEIAIDPSGPAGRLIDSLEKARVRVRQVKPAEFVQACGQLVDKITAGTLRHIDQPVLTRAVSGAVKRDVGDGAWKFSRTKSSMDISPLIAVALAAAGGAGESVYESRGLVEL